ncbi:hypothetical protein V5735_24635 (plasmid) [Haladaptatus sp. SPP-AMP-3]|uniref:hypothetical protein n=1 Tax=Haladaptatus sp. SPP-AMP-3 TaxID=3121295 RepID=UPI003C2B20DE
MRLDGQLPRFDVTERRHVVVDASPETTYAAMKSLDFARMGPVVEALGELRRLPERIAAALAGTAQPETPESVTMNDVAESDEWVQLAEEPGEEFVFGAVGKFWRPSIEWVEIEPDEFAEFDRPGYAKLAIGFSVRPYGTDRALLTYEARTATTDAAARRRFRLYWSVIGPSAGFLMGRALARIKAGAESATAGT